MERRVRCMFGGSIDDTLEGGVLERVVGTAMRDIDGSTVKRGGDDGYNKSCRRGVLLVIAAVLGVLLAVLVRVRHVRGVLGCSLERRRSTWGQHWRSLRAGLLSSRR